MEHEREVLAIHPVLLFAKLSLHPLVERSTREWVGNRDADLLGLALFHHRKGLLDILPAFPRIAILQEKPDADAVRVKQNRGLADLLYCRALLHRIQNF